MFQELDDESWESIDVLLRRQVGREDRGQTTGPPSTRYSTSSRRSAGGTTCRPRLFDAKTYGKVRSSVERFNAWVKSFKRVATRYERLPTVYMGFVHLACIVIYLRILQRVQFSIGRA
jgi:transposase